LIRITLHGDPGHRTGVLRIHAETWPLVTWHRRAAGMVVATTDDGKEVTFTTDGKGGGWISFGGRHWELRGIAWDGATMTGVADEYPSDAWLAGYVERLAGRVRG